MAAARKSGLKACLSQNLMTFLASVQRLVAGHFGEKAVNLGEQQFVVRWFLGVLRLFGHRLQERILGIRVKLDIDFRGHVIREVDQLPPTSHGHK